MALAGPPFLTDDPEPVDYRNFELYLFSTLDQTKDDRTLQTPALEFNWGAYPEVQLHAIVPLVLNSPYGGTNRYGLGDVEAGIKYRFVDESRYLPQIGIFPLAELASGDEDRGLGNGRIWWRLPLWIQKSRGPWTTYGGGGYAINHASGQRSYGFGGWLVQRDIGRRLILGGELFLQGATAIGGQSAGILNLGGYYKFTGDFNLLFSGGGSVSGERHTVGYLGLYWTWGPRGKP